MPHEFSYSPRMLLAPAAILACLATPAPGFAQSKADPPKFAVVSVKPCKSAVSGDRSVGAGGNDPGRLWIVCQTVENLIRWAYVRYPSGQPLPVGGPPKMMPNEPVQGGPAWLSSETFSIDARPESPQTFDMMRGPMLQAVLEDRFKLSIHRSTRQIPIYALVVAKGGPKLDTAKKDSCTGPPDFSKGLPPPLTPDQPPPCGAFSPNGQGGTRTFGQTMAGLSAEFSALLDRRVDDRTGLEGTFDINLDVSFNSLFTRFDHRPAAAGDTPEQPGTDPLEALGSAVRKLGLRLETTRGPETFIVIDHVERPSEN